MPAASAVVVEGLQVRLGGKPILKGVDLEVGRGELYGLLGRNGAGKTTSMRCMLGFLPFAAGSCSLFGVAADRLQQLTQGYGVALDPPGLDDSLTLRQNLEVACLRGGIPRAGGTTASGRRRRGVDEVLDLVGLTHRQGNRGDRLSHGQGRRAAVARALLGAPELLVLDEPLSGLDPQGVERLLELFRHLSREEGVTVVLSSHHLREVEDVCDRIGVIEDGRTLLEGEVAGLLAEAGDRLRLECRRPDQARTVLAATPGVVGEGEESRGGLEVRVGEGFDPVATLSRLVEGGAEVAAFERERASLVDVFQQAVEAQA
ncbi:MAG: ABC transporter ATP-binding protein [Planctomycetota bacterium]|jgi:ABC-2 type transport system ATP-binding protein